MSWSALDIIVVGVFVVQLAGWLCVLAAILKIKNGPVTHATRRILPLAAASKTLTAGSAATLARLKTRGLSLLQHTLTIRKLWNVADPPSGMWIEPHHLRQAAGLFTVLRQRQAPLKTPRKQRVPLPQRLGLVPPALTKLAPLAKIVRVALQTLKHLRP